MPFLRKDASTDDRSSVRPSHSLSRWPRGSRGLFLTLCFLLIMEAAGYHVMTTLPVLAAPNSPQTVAEGINTLETFLALDHPHGQRDEPFERPAPLVLTETDASNAANADLVPTVEPATMRPVAFQLDGSFLLNQPAAPVANANQQPAASAAAQDLPVQAVPDGDEPFRLLDSSGRLELMIPRAALDLTHATIKGGFAPQSGYILQVSQRHGNFLGTTPILGSYQLQVLDGRQRIVEGLRLTQPMTVRYHYTPEEIQRLGLNPEQVSLTWADLLEKTQQERTSPDGLQMVATHDAKAQTWNVQTTALGPGELFWSAEPGFLTPAMPQMASVSGNAGQFTYQYPIQAVPGPGGLTPQLALSYSSQSTNERYDDKAPAGFAGEGWSLGLGAIHRSRYGSTSATGTSTWHFLSGVAGISDRLLPDALDPTRYHTQHFSAVRIQKQNDCFQVWDQAGIYYEFGCTEDAQQVDATSGTYRWDLNKMVLPFNNRTQLRMLTVSYLQYEHPNQESTDKEAVIKQILYGTANALSDVQPDVIAGTIDFHYGAPTAILDGEAYVTPYGNRVCEDAVGNPIMDVSGNPIVTNARCDNPFLLSGALPTAVMSVMTLERIVSYVGNKASPAYAYDFAHETVASGDTCLDERPSIPTYFCAGDHLLTGIDPTVYQNGTPHPQKGVTFRYTKRENRYRDPSAPLSEPYVAETSWSYLTSYQDTHTNQGAQITYETAYGNTHGAPERTDPFACSQQSCTGSFAFPEDYAWSVQAVTRVRERASGSVDLAPAETHYDYELTTTSVVSQERCGGVCVGYSWLPASATQEDQEWTSFYHSEYRGFQRVFTHSPANDLTVSSYYTTAGWHTAYSNPLNALAGQQFALESYNGPQADATALLQRTQWFHAGIAPFQQVQACQPINANVYVSCLTTLLRTRTEVHETGEQANPTWSQVEYTYDDISPTQNWQLGYHNLLKTVTTSSNAPSLTQQWSYAISDVTVDGVVYHHVNTVASSKMVDDQGHSWQCQNLVYDERRQSGLPTPAAGWATTMKEYTNCNGMAGTPVESSALTSYLGYDASGNMVATVDPKGAAQNSLYASSGCTLTTAPLYLASAWTRTRYTSCQTYANTAAGYYAALPSQEQNALGHTTRIAFDPAQGYLPISVTDANNQVTTTSYAYQGKNVAQASVQEPIETASSTSQATTRSLCGGTSTLPCLVSESTMSLYPDAITRTFSDHQGRTVQTRTPLDATHDLVTLTLSHPQARTVFESVPFRVPRGEGWIDPVNAFVDNDPAQPVTGTTTVYDALGRVLAVQNPATGSAGEPGISCAGLSGVWALCQTYTHGSAPGDNQRYSMQVTRDGLNRASASLTDTLGRERHYVQSRTVSLAGADLLTQQTTEYNALNLPVLVRVTDLASLPGQNTTQVTTTMAYDDAGRMTTLTDPDRGTFTFTYDANGQVIEKGSGTRRIGTTSDLLNRVTMVCVLSGATCSASGARPLAEYFYDEGSFAKGRLVIASAYNYHTVAGAEARTIIDTLFWYDARGRQIYEEPTINLPTSLYIGITPTYLLQQDYNQANQPTTTSITPTLGGGYTVSQVYDPGTGIQVGLNDGFNTGVANLVRHRLNEHGLPEELDLLKPDATVLATTTSSYDGNLRPIESSTVSAMGTPLLNTRRGYDPLGNVHQAENTHAPIAGVSGSGGTETQVFCYDALNHLSWASNLGVPPSGQNCGPGTASNTLSDAGYTTTYAYTNLDQLWQGPLAGDGSLYQYLSCDSAHPRRLSGVYPLGTTCATRGDSFSYRASYDAWGNMTKREYAGESELLTFDALDQLSTWSQEGTANQEHYFYDAFGQRIARRSTTSSGSSITFFPFGLQEVTTSVTNNTTITSRNDYYLGEQLVSSFSFDGNTTQFYLTDALGSVLATIQEVGGQAMVQGNQVYDPYGTRRYHKGEMETSRGYTGQYADETTGLDYYNARYYDPAIGRFLSADALWGNPQGADPYTYVNGSPITYNDPSGHWINVAVGAGLGALWSGGSSVISQMVSTGQVDWSQVGKEAAAGAIGGAIAGLIPGAGLIAGVIGGAVDGAVSQAASNAFNGRNLGDGVLESALWGGAFGGAASKLFGGRPSSACGNSFSAETSVATPEGEQAISDLEVGDQVIAMDQETHTPSTQTVEAVFTTHHDGDLMDVILAMDAGQEEESGQRKQQEAEVSSHGSQAPPDQERETIHTTQNHLWLTIDRGWVESEELQRGDQVQRVDGSMATVVGIAWVPGAQEMYDLTVSQVHTFAVGDALAVVHNADCRPQLAHLAERWRTNKGDREAGAASNVRYTNTGDYVTAYSGSPVTQIGKSTNIARGIFSGCCAETNLYAKIAEGMKKGEMMLDDTIIEIVESHRRWKPPCGDCKANAQILANELKIPVNLSYRNKRGGIVFDTSYYPEI